MCGRLGKTGIHDEDSAAKKPVRGGFAVNRLNGIYIFAIATHRELYFELPFTSLVVMQDELLGPRP